jgi:hypothetical protein
MLADSFAFLGNFASKSDGGEGLTREIVAIVRMISPLLNHFISLLL